MDNRIISCYLKDGIVNLTESEIEEFKLEILSLSLEDGIEVLESIVDNQYVYNRYNDDFRKVIQFLTDSRFNKLRDEMLKKLNYL